VQEVISALLSNSGQIRIRYLDADEQLSWC